MGCGEMASLEAPENVLNAQRGFLEAGADAISTNTFGATPAVMAANDLTSNLAELAFEVNFQSAILARKAAEEFSSPSETRWVVGSMGPTLHALSIMGGGETKFLQLKTEYYIQAKALYEGGVDVLHLERCQDCQNVTAALLAIAELQKEKTVRIPILLTAELDCRPSMIDNKKPAELGQILPDLKPLAIGVTGQAKYIIPAIPDLLQSSIPRIAALPDTYGFHSPDHWHETPESLAEHLKQICIDDRVCIVGVGRGARPHFIHAVANVVRAQSSTNPSNTANTGPAPPESPA